MSEALFDTETVEELEAILPPAGLARLRAALCAELLTAPAAIHDLVEANDAGEARRQAHALKGAAQALGATGVAAITGEIEQAEGAALPALTAALIDCATTTRAILSAMA